MKKQMLNLNFMIKDYLSFTKVMVLFFILLMTFTMSSCKKDSSIQVDPVQNAKDWYMKSTGDQASIQSSNLVEIKVTKDVNWGKAQSLTLKDGRAVVTAPLAIKYSNGAKPSGSYLLILTRTDKAYTSFVVYDAKKDYFNEILSQADLTAIYKNAEAQNLAHKNKLSQAKKDKNNTGTMNAPLPGGDCLDYFWVEYLFDGEGNLIGYDETFLFTVCPDPNGNGGGGGGYSAEDLAIIENIMEETKTVSMSGESSSSFISMSPDGLKKKQSYSWSIAGNPLSGYVVWSHETGNHKKVGGEWQWESLVHNNFSVDNKPSYMTVNVTLNGEGIPVLGTYVAGMKINCNIEAYVLFKGMALGAPSKNFERESPVFSIEP